MDFDSDKSRSHKGCAPKCVLMIWKEIDLDAGVNQALFQLS